MKSNYSTIDIMQMINPLDSQLYQDALWEEMQARWEMDDSAKHGFIMGLIAAKIVTIKQLKRDQETH